MNEPPEAAIMQEKPRDVKKQRLVDIRLIGYSYLFLGNIISIGMRHTPQRNCTAPIHMVFLSVHACPRSFVSMHRLIPELVCLHERTWHQVLKRSSACTACLSISYWILWPPARLRLGVGSAG